MGGSLPLASIVSLSDKVPEPAEGPLPPLRGVPRNAPDSIVFPDLVGDLLLFVEEDSPAERHADESQHRMSPLEKNVPNGNMFAPRSISHANKITTFHCLLSKMPLSAKKHERGSGM